MIQDDLKDIILAEEKAEEIINTARDEVKAINLKAAAELEQIKIEYANKVSLMRQKSESDAGIAAEKKAEKVTQRANAEAEAEYNKAKSNVSKAVDYVFEKLIG